MIGYNLAETFAILLLMSIEGAISNALSGAGGVIEGLPGLLILVGISMAGAPHGGRPDRGSLPEWSWGELASSGLAPYH